MHATANPATPSPRPGAGTATRIEAGRALVNGIDSYYEIHGAHDGTPLVLLHGGGSTIDSNFGRLIPYLARTRRVIALEEQGHGRTPDRDEPFTFERSADDVAGLLRQLGVPHADLFGFSNGAVVALQVAIRHPDLVRALVFASSFTTRAGAQPQLWDVIAHADIAQMPQALKEAFLAVTPDPQKQTMHDKDTARLTRHRLRLHCRRRAGRRRGWPATVLLDSSTFTPARQIADSDLIASQYAANALELPSKPQQQPHAQRNR